MSRFGIVLTAVAAFMTAAANLLLRRGLTQASTLATSTGASNLSSLLSNGSFVTGIVLYGLAMLPWLKVVSVEQVGSAYPLLVGMTFVLLLAGSAYFNNEPLLFKKIAGIILILAGITLVSRA